MAKRRRLDPAPTAAPGAAPGVALPGASAPVPPAQRTPVPPAQRAPETKALFPAGPPGSLAGPLSGPLSGPLPRTGAPIARVAGEAALQNAVSELSDEITRARVEGRLAVLLPLDAIDASYLIRDRMVMDEPDMAALVASLRLRGQQMPIEVIDLGLQALPRYGLISGWRRLTALRQIGAPEVRAIIRPKGDSQSAYLAMVEENEVRAALSFYERARIVARAHDAGVFLSDREALWHLFQNAPRARRSKIGSFLRLVRDLDGPDGPALRFPAALPERLGLPLAQALEREPALAAELRMHLRANAPTTPAAEAATIRALLNDVRHLHASPAQDTDTDGPLEPLFSPEEPALYAAESRSDHPSGSASDPTPPPRLELLVKPDRLVLRGPQALDPDFQAALGEWLRAGGWLD